MNRTSAVDCIIPQKQLRIEDKHKLDTKEAWNTSVADINKAGES